MPGGYTVLYPDEATRQKFEHLLRGLPSEKRNKALDAIESLELNPRPSQDETIRYAETEPGRLMVFLRLLPGIPFSHESSGVLHDHLYAKHRITIQGISVVYAIDDGKKFVWLMGIREEE